MREKTNKLKAAGEERRILISILCHDMSNFLTIIDLTTKLIKNNDETNEKTKKLLHQQTGKVHSCHHGSIEKCQRHGSHEIRCKKLSISLILTSTILYLICYFSLRIRLS